MPLTMYDLTIPTLLRGFDVLSTYVDKASAFAREQGIAPAELIQSRLAPDMLPFSGQIQRASDKAKGGVARLTMIDAPAFADNETTFTELAERIKKTTTFLRSVPKERFEGGDTRSIEIKFRSLNGTYSGELYLMGILLPDFFFHVATAHAILRHRGLAIGKVDYLGRVTS
jgi:uncharacterized protein